MNFTRVIGLACLLALAGCGDPGAGTGAGASVEVASRSLVPADEDIAAIYNRSCRSCHTVAATQAPLTGDKAAWAPRMEKGLDTLVNSVVDGFGGMPPFGLCMACDVEQFEALILFMAEAK